MKYLSRYVALAALLALVAFGCRETPELVQAPGDGTQAPGLNAALTALNTETLGDINIPLASGTGVVVAGVGLVGNVTLVQPGTINIDVPGDVKQVLLYWSGHNATEGGDGDVEVNGINVPGELLGGPTLFFGGAWSTTYRADITDMGVVGMGANAVQISGMEYTTICPHRCQNLGAGLLVIYDDGSTPVQIAIKDGNDCAFYNFDPPLDTTVPQTFNFAAAATDRVATLSMFAGSVAQFGAEGGRPNVVEVTLSDGAVARYVDIFQGYSGDDFDAVTVEVDIPAGITSMTVQALSETDPESDFTGIPASFGWLAAAAAIPPAEEPELATIGDRVWNDLDMNGIQDVNELGIAGVVVELRDCDGNVLATDVTDADGMYLFTDLQPGGYVVKFALLPGYVFSPMDQGADDAVDSDADPNTGMTVCVTLDAGEDDRTWDAGMYEPIVPPATIGDRVWNDYDMNGIQDVDEPGIEGVKVTLMTCDGQMVGMAMTDADGLYLFTDLVPGSYKLTFELLDGYVFSPMDQGTDDAVDSDADPNTGMTVCVTLGPGDDDRTWDAGMYEMIECGECKGKVTVLTLQYNGGIADANIVVVQKKPETTVFDGIVQPGGLFTFSGADDKGTLSTEIKVYVNGALNTQIHTSCSQPIGPGLVKGDFLVVAGESREGGPLCPVDDPGDGGEGCEVGKPAVLTMKYTGENCDASDNTQDEGKVTCSGDPNFEPMVMILVTDKKEIDDDKAKVFFQGQVALNAEFDIAASNAGEDKLKSNTFVYIMDLDGNLLQSVGFHTSCSQPLNLDDQFGSLLLTGFTPFVK